MRSRLLLSAVVVATGLVVLPGHSVQATGCQASSAVMVTNASSPTTITFTGAELGVPAIHNLWNLTTGENNNKFQILGKAIGAAHDWMGNCTYPGLGIGNGSGWDLDTKNITLWSWANGINADTARAAIYDFLGISIGAVAWGSPSVTLTDTPFVFDARFILNKFSTREFEWDFNGDGLYEVSTGSTPTATTSFTSTGNKLVGVRVSAGAVVRTSTMNVEAFLPPPSGDVGVSINDGSARTTSRTVTVSVVWPTWATAIRVSNDGGFASARTVTLPLTPQFEWELDDAGFGVYGTNVYVRFVGARIDASRIYSDSIVLDHAAPTTTTTSSTTTTTTTTTVPSSDPVVSSSAVRTLSVSALSTRVMGQQTRTVIVVLGRSRSICAVRGSLVVAKSRGVCSVRVTTIQPNGKSSSKVTSFKVRTS
jgi:hypothetical protein